METDRKGLISLRNGKDGTINCHTVRYNSLWWGQWQKTRQRKCPSCLFTQNTQISQRGKTPFLHGFSTHVAREEKQQGFGRRGEGSKRKEEEKEEVSCLNHRCLPLLTSHKLEGCVPGIPRGKTKNKQQKNPTVFLSSSQLLSALLHRAGPAKRETSAMNSPEDWCITLAIRGWNPGQPGQETGGLPSIFSEGRQVTCYKGEPAPHGVTRSSQNKPLKTGVY